MNVHLVSKDQGLYLYQGPITCQGLLFNKWCVILHCRWHGLAPEHQRLCCISVEACHKFHMSSIPCACTSNSMGSVGSMAQVAGLLIPRLGPAKEPFPILCPSRSWYPCIPLGKRIRTLFPNWKMLLPQSKEICQVCHLFYLMVDGWKCYNVSCVFIGLSQYAQDHYILKTSLMWICDSLSLIPWNIYVLMRT